MANTDPRDTTTPVLSEAELDALTDRFMAHPDAWRGCHIFTSAPEQVEADKHLATLCTEEVAGHA